MSAWITPLKISSRVCSITTCVHCTALFERSFSQIDTWWDRMSLCAHSHGKITWKRKKYHNWCQTLQWRHNGRDGDSNCQPYDDLLNGLFRHISKENIKAPCHWPLWGEFTSDRWIPRTKGQWRGKCFHLMTASWLIDWRGCHIDGDSYGVGIFNMCIMTSSNGNIFRIVIPLCGESTGHRWIPLTKRQWRGPLMFLCC